jgi:predicted signal transduction protein with EAL and GGDEF domain
VLIGLDDFKRVNDATTAPPMSCCAALAPYGSHHPVDRRAYRVGGDEFAIVMPHADAASGISSPSACSRPPSARTTPARLAGRWPSRRAASTPSWPEAGELFAAADAALFWASATSGGGRDHDPARHRPQHARLAPPSSISRRCHPASSLRPVFQPIIDLDRGVLGYEGLVRPTADGFADPGSLFAAAAACDRVVELDIACFEVGPPAPPSADRLVSINLSPFARGPDFRARLADILADQRSSPISVILD